MLKEIQEVLDKMAAIETGYQKFVNDLPMVSKQHVNTLVKRQLNSTKPDYMRAMRARMQNDDTCLVIELDPESWIANAVESGADPFSLKDTILKSKKSKISKNGFRYMSIPIGHDKDNKPGTAQGQEYQKRIMDALKSSAYGKVKWGQKNDGSVVETQEIMHDDPVIQGLYRTREHKAIGKNLPLDISKSKGKWSHILFRTISENPESMTGATWEHPGIEPKHFLRKTKQWLESEIEGMLAGAIEAELNSMKD